LWIFDPPGDPVLPLSSSILQGLFPREWGGLGCWRAVLNFFFIFFSPRKSTFGSLLVFLDVLVSFLRLSHTVGSRRDFFLFSRKLSFDD